MNTPIKNSGSAVTGRTNFATTESVVRWLLQSPIGCLINEILVCVDVSDCWLDGIVLNAMAPDGGREAQQELPDMFHYLVLTLPRQATNYPAGITPVGGGNEN